MGGAEERRDDAAAEEPPNVWFSEYITPHDVYQHGVKELLLTKRTKYQSMAIANVGAYGRALFLDGKIQLTEGDEAFYHEPLVHAPIVSNRNAKSVLILGGADGSAAREALRWKSVERVVVVDIDADVVDACKTHMPKVAAGAFENPRCTLRIGDALDFCEDVSEKFDVIICDLTDPMENSPSLSLFTKEFFEKLSNKLTADGAMSIQGGALSLVEGRRLFPRIVCTLSSVFENVLPYQVFVPTYGSPLAMALASRRSEELPNANEVDKLFDTALRSDLQVLDGRGLHGLFAVPKCVQQAIAKENKIFTSCDTPRAFGRGVML